MSTMLFHKSKSKKRVENNLRRLCPGDLLRIKISSPSDLESSITKHPLLITTSDLPAHRRTRVTRAHAPTDDVLDSGGGCRGGSDGGFAGNGALRWLDRTNIIGQGYFWRRKLGRLYGRVRVGLRHRR